MANIPRGFWFILGGACAAVALIVGLIGWGLHPASLKTRLIAEVERATGRTMTVSGPIGVQFSLAPTVVLEDVTLANPPGFSRPEMVKVARVELSLALGPLLQHQIQIDHVALVRPDILLETNQAGVRNWVFTRQPTQTVREPSPAPAEPSPGGSRGFVVSFLDANLVEGRVGWLDGVSGRHLEAAVPSLTVTAPVGGPAQLTGTVEYEGRAIALTGRTGFFDVGTAATGTSPWPLALSLKSGDASLTAVGEIARLGEARGYTIAVDAGVPDPSVYASLFPGVPLASLKAVTVHVDARSDGGPVPTISTLKINVGSVAFDNLAPGTRLMDVSLDARGETPINVAAQMVVPGIDTDSGVTGTFGDLAWVANGATGPLSVNLEWNAASARVHINGSVQEPIRFAGFGLDLSADVPNPSMLSERAPPTLKSVSLRTRLTDAPGPIPFQFSSSAGDLTGEVSVSRLPRLSVVGQVSSQRLDLDAMRLAPPSPVEARQTDPGGPTEPAARAKTAPLIPDTKLPFDLIRSTDADIKFRFGQVRWGGADISGIDAALLAKDGVLRLDPFTIAAPDQRMNAVLMVDAAKTPPLVHLAVQAPSLALRPLLAMLGLPQAASGNVGVRADLAGAGDSPRTIAASLDGWAGVAIEGGQLDAKMINAWMERLRPLHIDGPDVTDLRCFAVRADAKAGVVTIQSMALNTTPLIIDGGGDVDLGRETVSLRLRPRAKIGGTGIAVPVRVSGPMGALSARVDISPGGTGGSGLAGLLLGGKDIMGALGGGDPCPAALARAREGAPAAGSDTPQASGGK